jgi:5-oxoprolinase (ATP-hydrolysing)
MVKRFTGYILMISCPDQGTWDDAFVAERKRRFSFIMLGSGILVENVRARATATSPSVEPKLVPDQALTKCPPSGVSAKQVSLPRI